MGRCACVIHSLCFHNSGFCNCQIRAKVLRHMLFHTLHVRRDFKSTWRGCEEHQRHHSTNVIDAAAWEDCFAGHMDRKGPAFALFQTFGLPKLYKIAWESGIRRCPKEGCGRLRPLVAYASTELYELGMYSGIQAPTCNRLHALAERHRHTPVLLDGR